MSRIDKPQALMDRYANPYNPGAGTPPAVLSGRESELDRFELLIARLSQGRNEKSLIVHGLRGVGKTVLLNRMAGMAETSGWVSELAEVRSGDSLRSLIARSARVAIARLERPSVLRAAWERAAGTLRSFTATLGSDGSVQLGFEVEPLAGSADSGDIEHDLGKLLVEIGSLAQEAGSGVVLLFDELQLLGLTDLEALIAAVHRVNQLQLPVAVVGGGLPTLPGRCLEAKTYSERLFGFPALGTLDEESSRRALVEPAAELGVGFSEAAVERILAESEGYPYFLQEWGKGAWNAAEGTEIDVRAVEIAAEVVSQELREEFFAVRLDRATPAERRYCEALASLGEGEQSSSAVARELGLAEARRASSARAGCIDKGLIYQSSRGQIAFTVPHFDRFLIEPRG